MIWLVVLWVCYEEVVVIVVVIMLLIRFGDFNDFGIVCGLLILV